ncbi:MAG: MBL fold metallo-hydrolase [Eubacterium sp.]|nr:MBL fold metallo-hydrolase [Eubacterium sp.]
MEIYKYESNLLSSNMYIIQQDGHAIIIDPFEDLKNDGKKIIDKIILTHEHFDHISGVNYWKTISGAPVLCSKKCAELIIDSSKNMAKYFRSFCKYQTWIQIDEIPEFDKDYVCSADEVFEDNFEFQWEGHKISLFELPGHSIGSIGILIDDTHFFSGDSLIEGVDHESNIPVGSIESWIKISKPRLQSLPDGIMVHPGHFREFLYKSEYINILT